MINFALAQYDFLVGDISGNLSKSLEIVAQARESGADLVLFPELALTGYPPEDLLLRPGFMSASHEAMNELRDMVHGIDVLMGHPWAENGMRYNAVSWLRDGRVLGRYCKQLLPNYAVFDERRYFSPGSEPLVVRIKGTAVGVIICEDAWQHGPAEMAKNQGAEMLLVPNASPYRDDKLQARKEMFAGLHRDFGLPVLYCNLVGGQDELVFDGRSMWMDRSGGLSQPGPLCEEATLVASFDPAAGTFSAGGDWARPPRDLSDELYRVLVRGLADYVRKNGFSDVVFGLSGGIDSALTLAIAVDALGADHVHTVMMPSRHTSPLSLELAQDQAVQMGVDHRCISIEASYEQLLNALEPSFQGCESDISEENLQARIRGDIVMALSNKFGWLPLVTSNKSELAVGYCTIYGDMCGGFGPLIDCFKTRVYQLACHRNSVSPAIPEGVITRPPSAELRPGQSDQDSLPPYEILDQILKHYIEEDWSISRIATEGFDESMVRRVAGMVLLSEYKRRQAPPGVRVTSRAFGRDRRYPITSGWRDQKSWH